MKKNDKIKNKIMAILWYIIINKFLASPFISLKMRSQIYRLFKMQIYGEVYPSVYLGGRNVKIGKRTFINRHCYFDNSSFIEIGEDCAIAPEVMFCTTSHKLGIRKRAGERIEKPIKVGDKCWIGTRTTILPGVTIGESCVIAAGSVVTKDCDSNGLYAGVPATRKKDLDVITL